MGIFLERTLNQRMLPDTAQLAIDGSLADSGLPNRLMTAFEVAEFRRLL